MTSFTNTKIINEFLINSNNSLLSDACLFWNNTKLILDVYPSKIPNAGNGIFTYKYIPKETLIGYYDGELKKDDGSCVGDYSFSLNRQWYVDARKYPRSYIAMINDAHGTEYDYNCEFRMENEDETGKKRKPQDRKITLWSIKNIKAGSELYADYGKDYWKCPRGH